MTTFTAVDPPLTQSEHYGTLARAMRTKAAQLVTGEAQRELTSLANAYERLASWAAHAEAKLQPGPMSVSDADQMVSLRALTVGELRAGATYDSWRCQQCRAVLALAPRVPGADPHDLPNAVIRLKCPNCGAGGHYMIHERIVRRFPWNAKAVAEKS